MSVHRALLILLLVWSPGCSEEPVPVSSESSDPTTIVAAGAPGAPGKNTSAEPAPAPLPMISLGGGSKAASAEATASEEPAEEPSFTRDDVLAAMKPLQILRDQWNAVRQRRIAGQSPGEQQTWIWDFRTNRNQPALVMSAPKGAYFQEARLTFNPAQDRFEMTTTDDKGVERKFAGTFSKPVEEFQGENNKPQRTYALQLTEEEPADDREQWQVVLNQQENNRYLLEISRKRGTTFRRFDTLAAQREGTSFALSDTDYGDRTCIISAGLGTIPVSFQGKTYYVCCSGCKAAFEEEPARWIAEYEARKKEMTR